MSEENQELAVVRDGRRFAFSCPPGGEGALIHEVVTLAADPACPLTRFDAALLCHQLRDRFASRIADVEADAA